MYNESRRLVVGISLIFQPQIHPFLAREFLFPGLFFQCQRSIRNNLYQIRLPKAIYNQETTTQIQRCLRKPI